MKKKIAIIASSIHLIRQNHLLEWFEDLSRNETKFRLFLGSKNNDIPYAAHYKVNSRIEKIKYTILNLAYFNKKSSGLSKIAPLVSYKPNIIHLLSSNVFWNIEPILENKNIVLIVSFRGFDINVFPNQSEANRTSTKLIFEKANILHFISDALKISAIALGAEPSKCLVIRRSIKTDLEVNHKILKPKNKKLIILSVGRLVWEKGYLYALQSIAILKNKGFNFEYQIAGSGIDEKMLIERAQELMIQDSIIFLGELSRNDVKKKLQEVDIYFQPSVTEALSLALIEASLFSLPIVSSNVGGIPEVVKNNITGFLSEPCNPELFANNLIKLLEDTELRQKMGNAGNKYIVENFSRDKEIENWKILYKHLE